MRIFTKAIVILGLICLPYQLGSFLFSVQSFAQSPVNANIPELSADGDWLVFTSEQKLVENDDNGLADVYLLNKRTNQVELISQTLLNEAGDGSSIAGDISADGRLVTFSSIAKNFFPNQTSEGVQVYLKDRISGELLWLSKDAPQDSRGYWGSEISDGGSQIAFYSTEPSALYLFSKQTRKLQTIFPGSSSNAFYGLSLTSNGDVLAFTSTLPNLVGASRLGQADVYTYNINTKQLDLVSRGQNREYGNKSAGYSQISGNGQWVVWSSEANNLVANDDNNTADIFITNTTNNQVTKVVSSHPNGPSSYPKISNDGTKIAFQSLSDFTKEAGVRNVPAVYVLDLTTNQIVLASSQVDGAAASSAEYPTMSDNGREVSYVDQGGESQILNITNQPAVASAFTFEQMATAVPPEALAANLGLIAFLQPLVNSGGLAQYQLILSRFILSLLSFLGLRKKRRVWGTVYDSQTKQPLDPAVVELLDATTSEVKERAITDLAGRFGFLATKGMFKLRSSKTHYQFPSQKEAGNNDEIFENLYHGEVLNLIDTSSLVAPNIPMDPVGFDWNQEAKLKLLPSRKRWQHWLNIFFGVVFYAGLIFSIFNTVFNPDLINLGIVGLYFFTVIIRSVIIGKRLWGRLTIEGQPGVDVKLELLHPKFGIVMGKALSTIDGKFFLKVPEPGDYHLKVSTRHGLLIRETEVQVGKECVLNSDISV